MTDEFRGLCEEITARMGAGWTMTMEGGARLHARMRHTDGRGVDLWDDSEPGRVSATGCFPETDTSVKRFGTSALMTRGAEAIAKQINGARFMAGYAEEFARVSAYNERQERQAAERKRVHGFLSEYIPETERKSSDRPGIKPRQAYEKTGVGRSGYEYTDRVTVDLEFSNLTPAEARMIMRAYSIAKGHTPAFLRPAA